ncbi:diguanylate cyclase [Oceanobacillus oncorhynchi subsp. incaldanensis]|uniref:sigma-54 interaction domain-containing protein n=1 Tax=Oceanobacillus oncorhynchi TaxID=545501 RepID=UPI001B25C9B0|nr:sigma 54-interacting transcriptional regulator [Oceanobacillus oncorhynchi]GIO19671.1 diguanylate cyclase [Oceanobacillus oncorhynchi subsp. incaldanensis]
MTERFIENKHFQHVFNHLKDGIFITDHHGIAIWANNMSTKQLGVPRSEIIGKHVADLESNGLFTPSMTKIVLERRDSVTKVQESKGRQYLATGYLVNIPEEDTEYILVQVKDITETVRASFQLEKAEVLIQKYWEELNELKQKQRKEKKKQLIIGKSKKHEEMIDLIKRVAPVDTTILLYGETGVGKSVVAKEIHHLSTRQEQPFIQINCGAIPESLLESELFGYKKGAFTGANNTGKIGLAEKADGGTLFLDEIAELPLHLQPKILQLVQNKSFIPIGSTETKQVDIRIIAATNQNLSDMVKEKRFREDLYYRLNVVSIETPALKDRKDDIPRLIYHFFEIFSAQYHKNSVLDTNVVDYMQNYSWPGNIRELENLVEFLVVTAKSDIIETSALPDKILNENKQLKSSLPPLNPESFTLTDYLEEIERDIIKKAQQEHKSTRKAAKSLGITQSSYVRRLKKYNLSS